MRCAEWSDLIINAGDACMVCTWPHHPAARVGRLEGQVGSHVVCVVVCVDDVVE